MIGATAPLSINSHSLLLQGNLLFDHWINATYYGLLSDGSGQAVHHFRLLLPPMLSCEAEVAKTCFLLKRSGFDPLLVLQFIQRGVV